MLRTNTLVYYENPQITAVKSTHPWLEKLARDEHSSLLQKLVNYGRKKFYDIGPRLHLQLPKRDPESDQPDDLSSFEDYETRPQYIPKRVRSQISKEYSVGVGGNGLPRESGHRFQKYTVLVSVVRVT